MFRVHILTGEYQSLYPAKREDLGAYFITVPIPAIISTTVETGLAVFAFKMCPIDSCLNTWSLAGDTIMGSWSLALGGGV